jgi:hypothetical protein
VQDTANKDSQDTIEHEFIPRNKFNQTDQIPCHHQILPLLLPLLLLQEHLEQQLGIKD